MDAQLRESNIVRLDDYRPQNRVAGCSQKADWEEFDLYDAYGRTIADWIWEALFEETSGTKRPAEAHTPEDRHCEVIYWQFAAGSGCG